MNRLTIGPTHSTGDTVPSDERRILFLCHRVPFPPDKGDRIRSYHLLQFLSRLGRVSLGFLTDEDIPERTQTELQRICERVEYADVRGLRRWIRAGVNLLAGRSATEGLFYSRKLKQRLDQWFEANRFDAVVCFSSSVLQYVRGRELEPRLIVDLVDVDSQKWLEYARRSWPPGSLLYRLEAARVRRIEREAAAARAVTLVTDAEGDIYRALCPAANVSVVTNGVDLEYFSPRGDAETPSCVFVGYLDYRANVVGLQWFCREVWPAIHARIPQSRFRIVGRNPGPAVQRLAEIEGVEMVGPVPDVRLQVAQAGVVVVPLLIARGVQNKVLEAMAMGKTVIASPAALEGLSVTVGQHVLCADSPTEWIRTLASVWSSPEQRQAIGRHAREYVEQHHNWESCLSPFADLIKSGSVRTATDGTRLSAAPFPVSPVELDS